VTFLLQKKKKKNSEPWTGKKRNQEATTSTKEEGEIIPQVTGPSRGEKGNCMGGRPSFLRWKKTITEKLEKKGWS